MMKESEKPFAAIVTSTFVSRFFPGPCRIAVEKIYRSSGFDRLQAGVSQDGHERIRAFGTFSREPDPDAGETRYEKKPLELPDQDQCICVPELPGYSLYHQMDCRLDPACAGWMTGAPLSERSELRGWIRFKDNRVIDALAILLIADAFPPPIFVSQGPASWVPTLEYTVNIRSLPAGQWIKAVFKTSFLSGGILEEDGELWDERGTLVAVSRQIAQ